MQLDNNVVIKKGFYSSIKNAIVETHQNIYGHFIISLDYLASQGTQKKIITTRLILTYKRLESLLDNLCELYDNFHLNYIIYIRSVFVEDALVTTLHTQFNKLDIASNRGNDATFDKQKLYAEFYMLKQLFKTKTFIDTKIKMLFVNENIKMIYMETGMNKI